MAQNPTSAKENGEDLRIRRTRKLLLQALMELTVEKGFNNVTVRDLCERAMVNRSTFYRHYLDIYQLLDQYMGEVFEQTTGPVEEKLDENGEPMWKTGQTPPGLVKLIEHVQSHAEFYRVMLGEKGDPRFANYFRQYSEKRFRLLSSLKPPPKEPNSPPVDLRVAYATYAGVCAIVWWLENGQPSSPEQLAAWLSNMTTTTIGFNG